MEDFKETWPPTNLHIGSLNVWRVTEKGFGPLYLLNNGNYELANFLNIPNPAFDFATEQEAFDAMLQYYAKHGKECPHNSPEIIEIKTIESTVMEF